MKKTHLEKPTFIEVGLTLQTRDQRIVSAYSDVLVLPEQSARYREKNIDIVSLLDGSLSRSLASFFPFHSIVSVDIREIVPSLAGFPLPFKGRDTFHIASNLAADILGQIL